MGQQVAQLHERYMMMMMMMMMISVQIISKIRENMLRTITLLLTQHG